MQTQHGHFQNEGGVKVKDACDHTTEVPRLTRPVS